MTTRPSPLPARLDKPEIDIRVPYGVSVKDFDSRSQKPISADFSAYAFSAYIDQLLAGPIFANSPRRRDLLRYLIQKTLSGAASDLSEYAIAVDALGRAETFDQRIDSSVRSEISRLRKFMAAYYAGSGAFDPWQVTFPARGYELKFLRAAGPAPESPRQQPLALPPAKHRIRSRQVLVAVGTLAVFLLVLGFAHTPLLGKTGKASLPTLLHRATPRHTPSPDAMALYLRGEFYWEHRTDGSLHQAIDAYTQAVVADSDYAEAYAGMAESYDLMPEYSSMPQGEAFTRAMAAANKAISLDPTISIAHRALAFALFWSQTDIPRAISEFHEAIRLAPDDAETHHWYATALNSLLREAEARREIDIAQQLAPASRSILADRALIRYSAGDTEAVAQLLELEAAEPDFRSPPEYLARIELEQGNYAGYLNQLHRLAAISKGPDDLRLSEAAQNGWHHGGNTGMLQAMRAIQESDFAANKSDGYDLARTCALLGEKQRTVQYLQAAIAAKDLYVLDTLRGDWAPLLNGYPPFESLRTRIRTRFGIAVS